MGGVPGYTFEWNFGDGSALTTEQNPAHAYLQSGTFVAVLTVRDTAGATASSQVPITVRDPSPNTGFSCDQIDFFWVASRRSYQCTVLASGGMPYTDSNLTLATIPAELENTAWIQTPTRDARRRRSWFMFFRTTAPVKVMVGFDAAARRLPRWLRRRWIDEGRTITLDDGRVMNIYSREYRAGWVVLGSNRARGARWPRGVRPAQYVLGLAPGGSSGTK